MKNTRMIAIFLTRKMFSNLNQIKTLKVDGLLLQEIS